MAVNQPTIYVEPSKKPIGEAKATFNIALKGLRAGQKVELVVFEIESKHTERRDQKGREVEVGRIKGTIVAVPSAKKTASALPLFTVQPDAPPTPPPADADPNRPKPQVGFRLKGRAEEWLFKIPVERWDEHEGESWIFEVRLEEPKAVSPRFAVAQVLRQLPVGVQATYDWHEHNAVTLYHHGSKDAAGAGGAFADMVKAIREAKHFIFIADWSFQPHFQVIRSASGNASTIGALLGEACKNAEMLVGIHSWDHTNIAAPDEQNDHGAQRLDETCGGKRPKNMLWRISSRSDFGMSHHQKFLVLDAPGKDGRREIKAFFGGLDLTKGRFDWDEHPIMPDDPKCKRFLATVSSGYSWRGTTGVSLSKAEYDDWYNAEFGDDRSAPREPWHDIHGCITGPAAWDVVREFVGRWNVDPDASGQGDLPGDAACVEKVTKKFQSLFDAKKFVQQHEPRQDKSPWSAQVYRSQKKEHWSIHDQPLKDRPAEFKWTLPTGTDKSIQHAYVRAIDSAKKFIYIETQYFISSGYKWGQPIVANVLAEHICKRIVEMKGKPFHCFIIVPQYPEGPPEGMGGVAVRQYEWKTMEWMVSELTDKLGPGEWTKYLSFYFPMNWEALPKGVHLSGKRMERATKNRRYMIYVHAKLMIVDDRYIVFGSANLNERSLNGAHDSEICIGMWPSYPAVEKECVKQIQDLRVELMTEHLGQSLAGIDHPEKVAGTIQKMAEDAYVAFRSGKRAGQGPLLKLPVTFDATKKELKIAPLSQTAPDLDAFIPDWPYEKATYDADFGKAVRSDPSAQFPSGKSYTQWTWPCPGAWALLGKTIPA